MLFLHKDWIIIIIMKTFILMAHLNEIASAFRRNTFQVRADRNNASLRNEDWRCNGTSRQDHYIHIFKQEQKYIYQMQMYDDNFVLRWQNTDNWELVVLPIPIILGAFVFRQRVAFSWAHPMTWLFIFNLLSGPGGKKNRQKERRLMKGFLAAGGKLPPTQANPPQRWSSYFAQWGKIHQTVSMTIIWQSGPRPHQHFRNRTTINLGEKRSRFTEYIPTHI